MVLPERGVEGDLVYDCDAPTIKATRRERRRRRVTRSNQRTAAEPGADTRRPVAAFLTGDDCKQQSHVGHVPRREDKVVTCEGGETDTVKWNWRIHDRMCFNSHHLGCINNLSHFLYATG